MTQGTEVHSQFFELLRIAIGRQDRFRQNPTEDSWEQMLLQANRQAVTGPLYMALGRLPAEQRPPRTVILNWHACTEKIRHDNRKANRDAAWACECFRKAGFRNVLLKGQGNATLYPDPLLRHPGDVDVWLKGSRSRIIGYVRSFFPDIKMQWIEMEFPIKKGCCIEVHTMPSFMSNPFDNRRLARYFREHAEETFNNHITIYIERGGGEGSVNIPTTQVNMLFQLTHIYRHIFNCGIGMRQIMDYYYLLNSANASSYTEETYAEVKKLHMTRFCSALMWIMHEVFGMDESSLIGPVNTEEGRFLLDEIMTAGNFGHHDPRINRTRHGKWANFKMMTLRNLRFLRRYPREVIWNPWYRICQYLWRLFHGYK